MIIKTHQSFVLFALGLILGALFYWLASISFFSRAENTSLRTSSRIIAYTSRENLADILKRCPQLDNINNKNDINIYCSFVTKKIDRGVIYKVKSKISIKTDRKSKKAIISVKSDLKEETEHITEADYCSDCSENITVDVATIDNLTDVSKALNTQISNILSQEEDRIESALETAYEVYRKKEKLKEKIANCEISKKSTVSYTKKITPEEKIKCRTEQMEDITNNKARTRFFHSTVKKDLWQMAKGEEPLERSFFLSDYIRELNNPDFFKHDYFSVRSAIDTIEKYSDLRRYMDKLGDDKLLALNNIRAQLPLYFYTNEKTRTGQQDRLLLESAWNKNFKEKPFPSYYSLSKYRPRKRSAKKTRNTGISANQFRAIVNSPGFKKLYQ